MKQYLIIGILLTSTIGFTQINFKGLDTLFNELHTKGEFNGIALIGNTDTILFSHSYGYADIEMKTQIDLNTQFYIASISKQFTATAILLLIENEKIKLQQPVKDILTDFPYDNVTIHHLLSQTSGIGGYIDYFAENWDKQKQANTNDVLAYLSTVKPELYFEPGTAFGYSNTNYVILAKIIEVVSNQSYPSFLERHIFTPLGLAHTYASYKPYFTAQDKNVAYGYVFENELPVKAEESTIAYIDRVNYLSGIQGDGSLVTSINDLFLWHKAIHANNILSELSTQLLFAQNNLNDGSKSSYGYGWYTDGEIVEHTGSWPGYQTRIIRNLTTGMVGITFKNVEINSWGWISAFDQLIKTN